MRTALGGGGIVEDDVPVATVYGVRHDCPSAPDGAVDFLSGVWRTEKGGRKVLTGNVGRRTVNVRDIVNAK